MNKGIWLTALSGVLYGSIGYFGIKLIESGLQVHNMLLWRFLASCLIMPMLANPFTGPVTEPVNATSYKGARSPSPTQHDFTRRVDQTSPQARSNLTTSFGS